MKHLPRAFAHPSQHVIPLSGSGQRAGVVHNSSKLWYDCVERLFGIWKCDRFAQDRN